MEIILEILRISPRTLTTVTDALTNLTDKDLNLVIEEVYRKELAKMPTQPPWDYRNPLPKINEGFWFANTIKENRSIVNKTSLKQHSATVDSSRKETINKLSQYFVKDYYDMDYNTQIIQMKHSGKLYRSKKHKKIKKCKSKRCHKKNIRKTRRRRM